MTVRRCKQVCQKCIFLLACVLPFAANSTTEEIKEKHIGVAMRMIGHEVLTSLGDQSSRILPIEKIEDHYKISFEFEFEFDPADIASIVDRVMTETGIASNYIVEMVQCETSAVVHSFEVGEVVQGFEVWSMPKSGEIACVGRILPEDCYSLLFTILEGQRSVPVTQASSSDDLSLVPAETNASNFFKSAYLIVPVLLLIGFVGYYKKTKNAVDIDPNLILIGASQFDKRNMALSFENKSVELSNKEAALLSVLHTAANAPVERAVILQRVWGDEGDYVGRTLDVFISKLRKKLEADTSVKIVNIRGVGYKLVMDIAK